LILTFHRTDQGYKMRCPSCGSVVRLRVRKKRRKLAGAKTELMAPSPDLAPPGPDEFNVELVPLSEAPAPPRHTGWVIAIVVAGVALFAGAAGLAWWLLG
jgi:hypothetical protein